MVRGMPFGIISGGDFDVCIIVIGIFFTLSAPVCLARLSRELILGK